MLYLEIEQGHSGLQTAADVLLTMSFEHIYMTSSILIFIQYNQALKNSTF